MLELKNVTKIYETASEKVEALKGISLKFSKTGFVSILGQSGCGKTTLLNIIGGLDRYTDGDIIINGRSTRSYSDRDWDAYRNNSIGFVFQSYNLISHLTVLQNVELAMTLSGVGSEERRRTAIEMLDKVGLGDQINKKPNQLSGGQMQRVAIARALVNDPEILLADEPTGALDSKSSVQIMDIIKEISRDRLVIMVTHNAVLAAEYSTRTIKISDGLIVEDDGDKLDTQESADVTDIQVNNGKKPKTSMSLITASSLSLKNLLTKKGRTFLTSFAGSIGIIGIAIVLAVSTGVNQYISSMESEFLGATPIAIKAVDMDMSSFMSGDNSSFDYSREKEFPDDGIIHKLTLQSQMNGLDISQIERYNDISENFVTYLKTNLDTSLYNSIDELRTVTFNLVYNIGGEYSLKTTALSQMVSSEKFVTKNYDVLAGEFSSDAYSLNLVIDENNYLSQSVYELFKLSGDSVTFDEIVGREFTIGDNDDVYKNVKSSSLWKGDYAEKVGDDLAVVFNADNDKTIKVRVASVLRVKNDSEASSFLRSGLFFNKELGDKIISAAMDSEIVRAQLSNPTISVLDNKKILSGGMLSSLMSGQLITASQYTLASINADESISTLNVYPADYKSRALIIDTINAYNDIEGVDEEEKISVTDNAAVVFDMVGEMTDIVTYALVAFLAVSLIVSTVMIAVITYISVIERTKEIGILRSIGARKKDIGRVFNAETFIIGLFSGTLGVIVSYVLIIIINVVLNSLVNIPNIAVLTPWAALILIAVSIMLTLISGLIPARMASRRDPIKALRSE